MKVTGGYNVLVSGRPSGQVRQLPEPKALYLPLRSRHLAFSNVLVSEGQRVHPGQVLAKDPASYGIPLLAPREGAVRLDAAEGHIVLEDIVHAGEEPYDSREDAEHVPEGLGSIGIKRYKLLNLGAWQFFRDALTGAPVEPFGTPTAVIVSTLALEPFLARGDVQLRKRLTAFTRGLEHLQGLLEYQPIYLVLPDIRSELARRVVETIRGYAWAKLVQVPLRYPFDHPAMMVRHLKLKPTAENPVWSLPTGGVLALDRALTLSQPCTVEIISLGGPAVEKPVHLKAIPGYPIADILAGRTGDGPTRVLSGGALTGEVVEPEQLGLDVECQGLTVLREHTRRELLGFVRPGFGRRSYSKCFTSAARGDFSESYTTALRGELRPCVACGECVNVCPARIMPNVIHKYLYQDELEQAQRLRVDLCIECGLCSYVCPSKIDLRSQFVQAKDDIQRELQVEEVEA
ncbi:MAG: 4Fe-4S dicluster domain-containing protein [Planctomycetota bacterium]|jgi:Na+-transporting NADH:ubiquinone oxidoreductase subunit A